MPRSYHRHAGDSSQGRSSRALAGGEPLVGHASLLAMNTDPAINRKLKLSPRSVGIIIRLSDEPPFGLVAHAEGEYLLQQVLVFQSRALGRFRVILAE